MDKKDVRKIAQELEQTDAVFADKSQLDILMHPSRIIGRDDKIKQLLEYLSGYKKGHVAPLISVYGRSGSGKSTIVRFVCESLSDDDIGHSAISIQFVNLRKAKTIFGCTNVVLAELGKPQVKSAQGVAVAIAQISDTIVEQMKARDSKLFVLVLDEFDVIFNDEHFSPSDFVYKLLTMHQDLKEKGHFMTIIAITNNVMARDGFDERIKSRIGSAEIYFEPYTYDEILRILHDRASKAFSENVNSILLQNIAKASWEEHGDVRRAIELLRIAGEAARAKGEQRISTKHLIQAMQGAKTDRVTNILSTAPGHLKIVCAALAKLTFLAKNKESSWHSTSAIYDQYNTVLEELTRVEDKQKNISDKEWDSSWANLSNAPLSYGRVADRLIELKNAGLVESQTLSEGRGGYRSRFRLTVRPELVGETISEEWWLKVGSGKLDDDDDSFKR